MLVSISPFNVPLHVTIPTYVTYRPREDAKSKRDKSACRWKRKVELSVSQCFPLTAKDTSNPNTAPTRNATRKEAERLTAAETAETKLRDLSTHARRDSRRGSAANDGANGHHPSGGPKPAWVPPREDATGGDGATPTNDTDEDDECTRASPNTSGRQQPPGAGEQTRTPHAAAGGQAAAAPDARTLWSLFRDLHDDADKGVAGEHNDNGDEDEDTDKRRSDTEKSTTKKCRRREKEEEDEGRKVEGRR